MTVYTQVLPSVVASLGTPLTRVKPQVPGWRLYMVVDPLPMHARDCGPSEGLLHMPSARAQKKS